jgi:hypothetical protein
MLIVETGWSMAVSITTSDLDVTTPSSRPSGESAIEEEYSGRLIFTATVLLAVSSTNTP